MKGANGMFILGVVAVTACLAVAGWAAFSSEPFISPDLGDLVLFVFTLGGAVCGFIAGYYWRRLTTEKS